MSFYQKENAETKLNFNGKMVYQIIILSIYIPFALHSLIGGIVSSEHYKIGFGAVYAGLLIIIALIGIVSNKPMWSGIGVLMAVFLTYAAFSADIENLSSIFSTEESFAYRIILDADWDIGDDERLNQEVKNYYKKNALSILVYFVILFASKVIFINKMKKTSQN